MTIGSNTSGHFFDTSLSADGVLYATSAGVVASTAVGTSGQVLTSNGSGSAPTFQTASSGVTGPGSSTSHSVATWNGTGGTALLSPPSPIVSSGGVMTNANQPAFQAYLSATINNVTGGNVQYQIPFNTLVYDQTSSFNTGTYTYTFPVAGIYLLSVCIYISGGDATANLFVAWASINGAGYAGTRIVSVNPSASLVTNGEYTQTVTFYYKASASDTMSIYMDMISGSKNINAYGGAPIYGCTFSGNLVC